MNNTILNADPRFLEKADLTDVISTRLYPGDDLFEMINKTVKDRVQSSASARWKGAKMAIEEIDKAGGIKLCGNKMMIEGVFRDEETKPQVTIGRLKEMVV